ncbi:MAG: TVP38/TMEM64 family protein [Oscillospiraceae bacterium]|nr:TVP38/TMEM64 family protein [Oscillospiraceae bacterium]
MKRQNKKLTAKQQKTIGIAAIVIAVIIVALITWLAGVPLVKFASQPEKFREWINGHGIGGRAAYIGMVIFQVIIAVLPGEPFEIAGGYAFGAVEGTILCIVASTMGSMLVFWLVRRYGTKLVEIFFSREKLQSVKFLKTKEKRDFLYLIIFMIPGTPKDLLSYAAGLTDVRVPVWLLICSLGRIPSIITSTVGGDALGTKNYWFAVIVFAVTLAVSAVGLLIYNRICSHHKGEDMPEKSEG